eukprot:CAMPEP_0114559510 /NCGR_PEP_ID=MMETSP0114-20121206/10957_1 /TAXON_ID=31324 /ORGANISM="Goniomonas sp, Strain m" /LENGTH=348 /DNA_ID=CAMNT_0001744979 /DNA_START=38 /DNA_END=1084 /DNA_ORIENTATION=-
MGDEYHAEQAPSMQQLNLDHVSPATRLLEKRRQMFEVQEALEAQKEEFARREDLFKRREEQLRKKDIDLQESLIRFNKFLQENDAKRARAEKKAADEVKMRSQKEMEVEQLTQTLEQNTKEKEKMKVVLEKNLRYLKYLEQVLETTEDYTEIANLLERYETLTDHHKDLTEWAQECAEKSDLCRSELQNLGKDGQDTKLKGHNEVATLQMKLEAQQLETMKHTSMMERRIVESAEKTLELGKIRWAIENLYERCRSRSKANTRLYHKDINQQLKVAQDFMMDLGFIVRGFANLSKTDKLAKPKAVAEGDKKEEKPERSRKQERQRDQERDTASEEASSVRGSVLSAAH